MSNFTKVQSKWMEAASDLQLSVELNSDIEIKPGVYLRSPVFVHEFGGEKGTLIFDSYNDVADFEEDLKIKGYGYSVQKSYDRDIYDREIFIEMLTEWGWTGSPNSTPKWYSESV
jgi:hypothetical protein